MVDYMDQKGLYDPSKQKHKIIICGCGSTGSFIALCLAKMGISDITCIDFDKVEEKNVPNQFYREKDIGNSKVESIKEIIKDFSGIEINTINEKIDDNFEFDISLNTIVLLCFDNMESRKLVYEKLKDMPIFIIDLRFGSTGFQIYSVDLINEEEKAKYEITLKSKSIDTPCGQKGIIYSILNLASEVCQIVKQMDQDENYARVIKREMSNYKILNDLNIIEMDDGGTIESGDIREEETYEYYGDEVYDTEEEVENEEI